MIPNISMHHHYPYFFGLLTKFRVVCPCYFRGSFLVGFDSFLALGLGWFLSSSYGILFRRGAI